MKLKIIFFVCLVLLILVLYAFPVLLGSGRQSTPALIAAYREKITAVMSKLHRGPVVSLVDIDQSGGGAATYSADEKQRLEVQARCGSIIRLADRKWRFGKTTLRLIAGGPCTVRYIPAKSEPGQARPLPSEKMLTVEGHESMEITVLEKGGAIEFASCPDGRICKLLFD